MILRLALLVLLCAVSPAGAGVASEPVLALALVGGETQPDLLLAQRVIGREWGASDDSVYAILDVPGWRSEPMAFALSAAVPGAGQAYVGSSRAWWFALAEAAGWAARWISLKRGHEFKDDAAAFAGSPDDTTSRWSFERWTQSTGRDASDLRTLYARDREAFYDRLASDPSSLAGWSGDAGSARGQFTGLRDLGDDRLAKARWAEAGLWVNHVVSAFDALRSARLRDIPLTRDTRLRLGGSWHSDGPQVSAVVRRNF